ncbi:MAG: hypothetical protein ABJQ29_08785 [Luteolibacter sp.]
MKKPLAFAMMFALLFTATAEAKKKKGGGGKPKVDKEKVERERKRDEEKKAVDDVLDRKDTNNDNQLTITEWLDGEDDEQGQATTDFMEADKNRDRKLQRSEIGAMLGF